MITDEEGSDGLRTLTTPVCRHHKDLPVGDWLVGAVIDGPHVGRVHGGPHGVQHRGTVSTGNIYKDMLK